MHRCTNGSQCPYLDWGKNGSPLEAYDQDEVRWKEVRPNHRGQCLNCIDDEEKDREWSQSDA